MSGRMPEYMSDSMSENIVDRIYARQIMSECMPYSTSEYVADRMPDFILNRMPKNICQIDCQIECRNICQAGSVKRDARYVSARGAGYAARRKRPLAHLSCSVEVQGSGGV